MIAPHSDTITILLARRKRLAKLIAADGQIVPYDHAYRYDAHTRPVSSLFDLFDVLTDLVNRPDRCVVRGELVAGATNIRRLLHRDEETGDDPTLRDIPRRWLATDHDGVPRPESIPPHDLLGCAGAVIERLPVPFRRASCVVQATGSHGIKPGCRIRLWHWCSRPMSGAELKRWLPCTDTSVFRAHQPIYTSCPIFAPGLADHLPQRITLYHGDELLQCPSEADLAPPKNVIVSELPSAYKDGAAPRKAIQTSLDKLRNAKDGERHEILCKASFTLGGLLGADLGESDAERLLLDAVKAAGGNAVVESNAKATIKSCLKAGRASPLSRVA